jgi:alpha-beta hydrolase superfamily lysophospholipase
MFAIASDDRELCAHSYTPQLKTFSTNMPSLNITQIDDDRWQHGFTFVDDANEVRIHYIDCPPATGSPKGTVLLIHGYPNTSYQWRHVITPISNAGYRVIAPDYRGAGDNNHPRSGYDKVTVADDLYKVVHDYLGRSPSIPVHDYQ